MSISASFARFLLIGATTTAVQYLVLLGLVAHAGLEPLLASATGYVVSALVSYALNRQWTFASSRSHREALPRFIAVAASGLLLNTLLVWLLTAHAALHFMIAQVAATVLIVFWNFLVNRYWTFPVAA